MVGHSDAHFDELIGRFEYAVRLLNEMDFPKELVLNRYSMSCFVVVFGKVSLTGISEKLLKNPLLITV